MPSKKSKRQSDYWFTPPGSSLVSRQCPKDCMYRSGGTSNVMCDYILVTGESRGCGIGKECDKYKPGKRPKKGGGVVYIPESKMRWEPVMVGGQWKKKKMYRCPICGHLSQTATRYCTQCGTKMENTEDIDGAEA